VTNYRQAAQADQAMLGAFCREMHARGVYLAPAWHHGLCALHTDALVDQIVALAKESARAAATKTTPARQT
jgi:glutamate-1-semialdehyde aminotransferase